MNIVDSVAVITGGASGIGRATTKQLVKRGVAGVAMVDFSDKVDDVVADINKEAGKDVTYAYKGDVTDETFREHVFQDMTDKVGVPRILVPAAGITRDDLAVKVDKETGELSIYPVEHFRKVVEVNMIAPIYWAMQLVGNVAVDRRSKGLKRWSPTEEIQGSIIFIGSIASVGNKGQISYSSTKAGLEGAAATLMMESMFHGVRTGVIHPGFTDTPMVRALGEDFINTRVLPQTQLRRLIKPEEIADAICFMITNVAMSGELWADAGWRPAI